MGTRANIMIQNDDGSVDSIFNAMGGSPTGLGNILRYHYASEAKVRQLIRLGDVDIVGAVTDPYPFVARYGYSAFQERDPLQDLDATTQFGIWDTFTWAGNRDIKSEHQAELETKHYASFAEAQRHSADAGQEYSYLFIPSGNDQGIWRGQGILAHGAYEPLTKAIAEDHQASTPTEN